MCVRIGAGSAHLDIYVNLKKLPSVYQACKASAVVKLLPVERNQKEIQKVKFYSFYLNLVHLFRDSSTILLLHEDPKERESRISANGRHCANISRTANSRSK